MRRAVKAAGGVKSLAKVCAVSGQAVYKWIAKGRLPRTEYSGETNYAGLIAAACREKDPHTKITREALLGLEPVTGHSSSITAPKAQERVA